VENRAPKRCCKAALKAAGSGRVNWRKDAGAFIGNSVVGGKTTGLYSELRSLQSVCKGDLTMVDPVKP
jgi:hypothetical protein